MRDEAVGGSDAPFDVGDDDFHFESLAPAADGRPAAPRLLRSVRRLPRRRVALFTAWIVLLALAIVASNTGLALDLWAQARYAFLLRTAPVLTRATLEPRAPGMLMGSGWERTALPVSADRMRWYTSSPTDPATIYACSGAPRSETGLTAEGPLTFWRTQDAGQRWVPAALPTITGHWCYGGFAPDAPRRLIATFVRGNGCDDALIFLSGDAGVSWRQASGVPPAPPEATSCGVQFWVTKRHVFAVQYYQNTRVPDATKPARTYTSFFRSDDGGGTWTRLDAAMPRGSAALYPYPTPLADGDTLLMSDPYYVPNGHGGEDDWGTRLWRTRDTGQSWQLMATLSQNDGSVPVRALGAWSGSPTLSHPLYVLGDAIDSHHFRIVIEQVSDLQHWSRLPPLPVAGATADRLGVTTVLAETSSGKLLVLGVGPHDTVPAAGADPAPGAYDQQWLWEWDPRAVRWIGIAPALQSPWPSHCSDHCFVGMLSQGRDPVHAGTYLWIGSSGWDSNILSRLLLPAGT